MQLEVRVHDMFLLKAFRVIWVDAATGTEITLCEIVPTILQLLSLWVIIWWSRSVYLFHSKICFEWLNRFHGKSQKVQLQLITFLINTCLYMTHLLQLTSAHILKIRQVVWRYSTNKVKYGQGRSDCEHTHSWTQFKSVRYKTSLNVHTFGALGKY